MAELELYGSALCPFVQRVRLALAEKAVAATEIDIDPGQKPARFLELSPAGKVPLLVHDGAVLWGSAVINEYLDETFPEPPLLPPTAAGRALARLWISFADAQVYEPTHRLLVCSNPNEQEAIARALADALRFLEAHTLATHHGPYLLGDDFSLADIALFPWFEQIDVLERFRLFMLPAEIERTRRWRDAVAGRHAVSATARSADFYVEGYAALLDQPVCREWRRCQT